MELIFLLGVLAVALVEWTTHRYLPAHAARLARFPGPSVRFRAASEGLPDWPKAERSARVRYGPATDDTPAYLRVRAGTDPALARIELRRVGEWVVLETRIQPAVGLAPYLFALLPAFVAWQFGPPRLPGFLCAVLLLVGWFVGVRGLLLPGLRRQVRRSLRDLAIRMNPEKATSAPRGGASATPRSAPRRRRRKKRR